MADYFTQFSCVLEVGADNVEPALAFYAQMAQDLQADDDLEIGVLARPSRGSPSQRWRYDEDHDETAHVIAVAPRCAGAFDLPGRWGSARP